MNLKEIKLTVGILLFACTMHAEEPKFEDSLKDIRTKVAENRKQKSQGGEIHILPEDPAAPNARCFFRYTKPIEIDYPWADWNAESLGHTVDHWHDNEINFFLQPARYKEPRNPWGASHWFRIIDKETRQPLAIIGFNNGYEDGPNLGIADKDNMSLEKDRNNPSYLSLNRPNSLRVIREYKHGFLGMGKKTELLVECSYPWTRQK